MTLRRTIPEYVSAFFASLTVGVLVGCFVCLGLLGFGWWADVPSSARAIWVYWPAVGTGSLLTGYLLWQFISGSMMPSELWQIVSGVFDGVNDGPP